MVESFKVRMPPKLKKAAEEASKIRGNSSLNEFIVEAIEHSLKCRKAEPSMKIVFAPIQCDCECRKCHRKIPALEWAVRIREDVYCGECYVERMGTKGTAKLALLTKELKYKNKVLELETDRKLEEYEEADFVGSVVELLETNKKRNQSNMEVNEKTLSYLNDVVAKFGPEEEEEGFKKVMKANEDLIRDREDDRIVYDRAMEKYDKLQMAKKKRKKRKEEIHV